MAPSPHADFASALRNPFEPSSFPAERFAIYRNNRLAGLRESLAATFAATQRIVGEDFFGALARAYIAAHPPRSPVLLDYGADLPAFIDGFAPAASVPYLGDVARIEWAWMHAYHAEDATPLTAQALCGLDDADIEALAFALHPSLAVIASAHPAGTIWQMNADGGTPGPVEDWHGENILVVRPHLDVDVRILPDDTAQFLSALGAGLPLGLAAEAGRRAHSDFDLPVQLATAFALGLIAGISRAPSQET